MSRSDHPTVVALAVAEAAKEDLDCTDVRRLNVYGGLKLGIVLVRAGDGTFATASWAFEGETVQFKDVTGGLSEDLAESDYKVRGFRLLARATTKVP